MNVTPRSLTRVSGTTLTVTLLQMERIQAVASARRGARMSDQYNGSHLHFTNLYIVLQDWALINSHMMRDAEIDFLLELGTKFVKSHHCTNRE